MKRIKFQTLAKLGTCMLLILLLVKVFIGEWVYIPSDSMFLQFAEALKPRM